MECLLDLGGWLFWKMGNRQPIRNAPVALAPFDLKELKGRAVSQVFVDGYVKEECLKYIEDGGACYLMGLYYCGLSQEWDVDLAMKYLEMAIERGNKAALVSYALFYFYGGALVSKFKWVFRKAALPAKEWWRMGRESYIDNKQDYGKPFSVGKEVLRDQKRSFELLSRASGEDVENLSVVYEILAAHYEHGLGVEKDRKKALDHLKCCYELVQKDRFFKKEHLLWQDLECSLKRIKELYLEMDDLRSDEALGWMLKVDHGERGYNIKIAKVYEARGDYYHAIKYCSKEIMCLKGSPEKFDECYDAKQYKKKLMEGSKPDDAQLREKVAELTAQMAELRKLVPGAIASEVPIVPAVPVVEPPAYVC
ncbi:MAG: hypothetical protein Hyperionvirus5_41 [Hyperionvirus sp.]|uniref:Sel1 repeat family protein n=1 Tax=Hyperionvirus sp. TaxID=2487770 RepID=A0A3G5A7M7_9VIRU|nr:MAG: hypothetical protein Hyperionvirus5_41 [Hyperionvirus sp.]